VLFSYDRPGLLFTRALHAPARVGSARVGACSFLTIVRPCYPRAHACVSARTIVSFCTRWRALVLHAPARCESARAGALFPSTAIGARSPRRRVLALRTHRHTLFLPFCQRSFSTYWRALALYIRARPSPTLACISLHFPRSCALVCIPSVTVLICRSVQTRCGVRAP
jgi:hypothetical protein